MISQATKYRLYLLLKAVGENETIVETQRQNIAKCNNFEPYSVFRRLCSFNRDPCSNVISAREIVAFLR